MIRVEGPAAVTTAAPSTEKNPTGLPERFQVRVQVGDETRRLCVARCEPDDRFTEMRSAYVHDNGPNGHVRRVAQFYLTRMHAAAYDDAIQATGMQQGSVEYDNYSVHLEPQGRHPHTTTMQSGQKR